MSFEKNRSSKYQFVGHKTFYVCDPSGEKIGKITQTIPKLTSMIPEIIYWPC